MTQPTTISAVDGVAATLSGLVAAVVAPASASGARRIDGRDERTTFAVERDAVRNAAAVRRREFASGRALLRTLIGDGVAIPIGPDRRPVLPSGVSASISHDAELVVGVAAPRHCVAGLGVDVEHDGAVVGSAIGMLRRADDGDVDPTQLWTMKEAAYKAWSNAGGGFLEHGDVRVTVDGAHFSAEVLPAGVLVAGTCAWTAGRWLAVATCCDAVRND
jgi:4'-phosphopantetheinyl transferase EntD